MKKRTKNVLCGLAMVASFGLGYAISPGKDKVIETIKEVQGIEHGVETCERGFELTNEYLNTCDLDADAAVALSGKALNGISGDYLKDSIKLATLKRVLFCSIALIKIGVLIFNDGHKS